MLPRRSVVKTPMAQKFTITYNASRDMLGLVSDEEYERFKDLLLSAFQEEWPDAQIGIEDDEEAYVAVDGVKGDAEHDVRARIEDIVTDIVDSGGWQDAEDDSFDEDEEIDEDEDKEY
jgi:hypothetical protein